MSTFPRSRSPPLIRTTTRLLRVRAGELWRRRPWRAFARRHTGSAWTDSGFRMSVGSLMGSIGRSGTSTSDHAIPVSCAGGLLLFIIDRRGSCSSLATHRPFLLLLSIHGSRMMIYTTGGCTTRIISYQQVRCALCQGCVLVTTSTGSSASPILSWHQATY